MLSRSLASLSILLLVAGCGRLKNLPTDPGAGGGDPDPTATFTRVQNEIFTPSCAKAGCHDAAGQQQGLILSSGQAYALIVGRPSNETPSLARVAPGDPSSSYLYRKVIGTGITGQQMPLGGPYLSVGQIALLRDWIKRGAPND